MIWESWGDFFAMGGYALYVWGSLLAVVGFMLGEVINLRVRGRAIRRQLGGARSYAPRAGGLQ